MLGQPLSLGPLETPAFVWASSGTEYGGPHGVLPSLTSPLARFNCMAGISFQCGHLIKGNFIFYCWSDGRLSRPRCKIFPGLACLSLLSSDRFSSACLVNPESVEGSWLAHLSPLFNLPDLSTYSSPISLNSQGDSQLFDSSSSIKNNLAHT